MIFENIDGERVRFKSQDNNILVTLLSTGNQVTCINKLTWKLNFNKPSYYKRLSSGQMLIVPLEEVSV